MGNQGMHGECIGFGKSRLEIIQFLLPETAAISSWALSDVKVGGLEIGF